MEHSIITFSGVKFDLENPKQEDIRIIDIAHSLSLQCRYIGHGDRFYSVAEHCVCMSKWVTVNLENPELAFACLMHDAAEAYVGDLHAPLKNMLGDAFKRIENKITQEIEKKYMIQSSPTVKSLDKRIVINEWESLGFPKSVSVKDTNTAELKKLPGMEIYGLFPATAKALFLDTYIGIRRNKRWML
mgnify:CR=1 FL=1